MSNTSTPNVPLTVVSGTGSQYPFAQIAIGKTVLNQQSPTPAYWILVINRYTLNVEFNQLQAQPNVIPNLGGLNSSDHILIVATLGLGLDRSPQGGFFGFLDVNGAGMQLRRVNQVAEQIGCGSLGTFGYGLVSILGNLNQPGFEASNIASGNVGPIITVQLMPVQVGTQVIYTPVALSNA